MPGDLPRLFHRLNNQLGVILANAELLESRIADDTHRARAAQVVTGAIAAIAVVQELRRVSPDPFLADNQPQKTTSG